MASIKISLVGDVRAFVSSFKKGRESVEDLADEIDDLAKEGDQTERSFVDNFQAIEKAAKEAGTASGKIGDGTHAATRKAAASTAEFKDEAKQNFAEVASSFSGDMSSAADLVQGTLGGLAGSLGGPIGLALGAASVALGAVIAQAQKDAEKAEELRMQAVEAVKASFEEGVDVSAFLTAADQVAERIQALEESKEGTDSRWFWEEDPSRLKEWSDALDRLGHDAGEIGDVLEADTATVKRYEKATEASKKAVDDQIDALKRKGALSNDDLERVIALEEESAAYDDVLKNIADEITLRDQATESSNRQRDAGVDAALKAAEAEKAAADAAQEAADRRASIAADVTESAVAMYDSIRDSAVEASTSEEGVFDLDKWLTLVADSRAQAEAYQANLALLKLTPEQWENYLALPEDVRANIAASYAVADEGTKTRIVDALTDAGSEGGTGLAVGFDAATSDLTADADVDVKADVKPATDAIEKVAAKKYEATITARTDATLPAARDAFDDAARSRSVSISAVANTSGLDAQLRYYRPPTVYVPAVLVNPGTRQPI